MQRESWRHDVVWVRAYANWDSEGNWLEGKERLAYEREECLTCNWKGEYDIGGGGFKCENEQDDEPSEEYGGKSFNQQVDR